NDGNEKYAIRMLQALTEKAALGLYNNEGPLMAVWRNIYDYYSSVRPKKRSVVKQSSDMKSILDIVKTVGCFDTSYSQFKKVFVEFMQADEVDPKGGEADDAARATSDAVDSQQKAAHLIQNMWKQFANKKLTDSLRKNGASSDVVEQMKRALKQQRLAEIQRNAARLELAAEKAKMVQEAQYLRDELERVKAGEASKDEVTDLKVQLAALKQAAAEQADLRSQLEEATQQAAKCASFLAEAKDKLTSLGIRDADEDGDEAAAAKDADAATRGGDGRPLAEGRGLGADFDEAAAATRMDHSPGLANTGGTDCFINTMLQCVFSSPELVNYIHSVVNSENNASAVSTEPVLAALKAVFNQYFCAHKVDHSVLAPFHKALRFAHPAGTFEINSQGDPAEAFNVLFGKLADVLPMTDGQVVQSKTLYDRPCEKCNATSFSAQLPEPCYPLNLAAGTIADLIQRDTAARHEDHIECANCSVPHGAKHYVSGTRRTIIVPNSPYLAFSLKRVALGGRKITTPVVIDDNIVIPDSEHVAAATYQVVAIGEHAGGRAEGGHWNVFKRSRPIWDQEGGCFIPGPTAWECCNDDSVEADIDVDLAALNSKAALVIYERVAGGEPRDVAAAIAEGEGKRPGSPVEAAAGVKIAQEQAARLIQAAWRGFSVRKTRRDNPRGRKDHLIEEAAALKAAQEGQRKADMLREQAQRELAVEKSKMQADADLLREEIRALRAAQQEARPQGNRSEVAKLRIELAQLKATAVEQKRLQDELAAARAEAEKNARLLLQLQAQMRAAGVPVDVAAPGSVRLEPPVDVRGVVEPPALVVVPEYEKYARLLKMGQPVEQLKLRAAAEGLDPNMIDQLARAQGVPAAVALPVAQDQGRVGDAFVEPVVPRLPLAGTQNFLGGIADGRRGLKKGAEKPNVVRQDKPLDPKQGMLDAIRQKKPVDDAAVEAERKAEKMSDFTSEVNRIFGKDSRNADKVSQCLAPAFLNNVLVREQLSGDLSARLQAFLTEYKASLNAKPKILKGLIEAILTGKVAAKMAALLVPPVFKEGDIMEYITKGYDTWLLAPTARKDDVIKLCRDNLGKGLRMARLPVKNEIVRLIATGKTIETITEYMQANLTPAVPKPAVQEQQTAVKPRIQDMLEARGIRRMVGYSDDEDGSNSDEEWDA
ncbi:hypothetical protein FJ365_05950, partial [Candidatus Dependentiae bacterium]|nr:hypothetical protein [Candidatus Dependentiae bacterium]